MLHSLCSCSHTGSSPLARGLRVPAVRGVEDGGIIPARAGFTKRTATGPSRPRDHPRSRGVYSATPPRWRPHSGSSPLARGLLNLPGVLGPLGRIIPARAGFTRPWGSRPGPRRDHPRSRGVYSWRRSTPRPMRGSSPLARGLRVGDHGVRVLRGIIPARAGFTRPGPGAAGTGGDHPRSRGVYRARHGLRRRRPGSSPLARGLHARPGPAADRRRIIPARAGFTWWRASCRRRRWDHPRSRGVYRAERIEDDEEFGSSPLARGLPRILQERDHLLRIIPARAGFTRRPSAAPATQPDHPRSRGVYQARGQEAAVVVGSSPLARGLLITG